MKRGQPERCSPVPLKVLEELKKQHSKIIVISHEDRIATIGELSFRVGDMIEGFQVTAITTDGIVLTGNESLKFAFQRLSTNKLIKELANRYDQSGGSSLRRFAGAGHIVWPPG